MDTDLPTAKRFFASSPFMADLGVEPTGVEPGVMLTQLVLQRRHEQHTGVVHAGVMAALADHTMGAAAQTLAPAGHWILTAELKTSLLRGAAGERLECRGWVIKSGRMLAFTEAEVWIVRGDERLLAMKASATMAVTPKR
jgi:uncharacterized protein (TIGR00369 family)